MMGVCDSTSPVKAKEIAFVDATVVEAVETTDTDAAVPVQPVAMQANTNTKRLCFTQPIYCGAITAACRC